LLEYGPSFFNNIVNYTDKVYSTISEHLPRLIDSNTIKITNQNELHYHDIKINKSNLRMIIKNIKIIHEKLLVCLIALFVLSFKTFNKF